MLLHTITRASPEDRDDKNLPVTMTLLKFTKFIADEIFPGGQIPIIAEVEKFAGETGFTIDRIHRLSEHYAKTLDIWAATLESSHDEAVALQSRGDVRAVHEVPDGLLQLLPQGLHRPLPVHAGSSGTTASPTVPVATSLAQR